MASVAKKEKEQHPQCATSHRPQYRLPAALNSMAAGGELMHPRPPQHRKPTYSQGKEIMSAQLASSISARSWTAYPSAKWAAGGAEWPRHGSATACHSYTSRDARASREIPVEHELRRERTQLPGDSKAAGMRRASAKVGVLTPH